MLLIQQLTDDPLQQQQIILPDGSAILLQIYFRQLQLGWFINQLTYKTFQLQGLRITNSPNMLYQFRNQIPFGIACLTPSNREPSQLEDFSSSTSQLYLLSADEVDAYERFLTSGT